MHVVATLWRRLGVSVIRWGDAYCPPGVSLPDCFFLPLLESPNNGAVFRCDRCDPQSAGRVGMFVSIPCPTDEVIALYLSGQLEERRIASFRQHLDGCDSCRVLMVEAGRSGSVPMAAAEIADETHVGAPRMALVGRLARHVGQYRGGRS